MSQPEEIKAMVATMLMLSPAEVGPGTSLKSLDTSLGSARLRLGLKRLNLALPSSTKPATFGTLLAALSGEPVPAEAVATPARPLQPSFLAPALNGLAALQLAIDVQDIRALPAAADFWEHEFYKGSFSTSEIAYAVLQSDPRTHLAGFWCAKEALRKCDATFAGISPPLTAVAHDPNGSPFLTLITEAGRQRLPHSVSISHTTDVATAIVATLGTAQLNASPTSTALPIASPPMSTPEAPTEPPPQSRKPGALANFFGLGA